MSKKFDNILKLENDVIKAEQLYIMSFALAQAIINGDIPVETYEGALNLFSDLLREHSVNLKGNLYNLLDDLKEKKVGAINDK